MPRTGRVLMPHRSSLAGIYRVFVTFLSIAGLVEVINRADSCVAATYYFSSSGDDSAVCGSPAAPCRSIDNVNKMSLMAGDSIRLRGGDEFRGCIAFNPANVRGQGSSTRAIMIDSFGDQAATLLSNCPGRLAAALTIDAVSGITVQNLIISAAGTDTAVGILIQNSRPNYVVDTIVIQNVDVSGFNTDGPTNFSAEILVRGQAPNGRCGHLQNIQVLNSKLHGAAGPASPDDNGITGYGCGKPNISNVKYSGNEVYNIGGHTPAPGGTSGNGILAAGVDGGELSFNVVHDNGANVTTCGGPGGVWAFRSANVSIMFNEVYRMRPLPEYPGHGACDWVAYDLDAGVTNSIVQYNYSHDNAGPALLAYAKDAWGPNTFRYNISQNDNLMMINGGGAVAISAGGVSYVYNNTIFRSGLYSGGTPPSCIFFGYSGTFPSGTLIANNLCINSMTDRFGRTRYLDGGNGADVAAITLRNNMYYNPQDYNHWNWNRVEYSSLVEFQQTKHEMMSLVANPILDKAGLDVVCPRATTEAIGVRICPRGYLLGTGSSAIGAGANLHIEPLALDVGIRDYYGQNIPHSKGNGFNLGADGSGP
jgi:hypothetical protein